MYTVKTKAHFDSAHFLKGYEGKCSNIHGHRWEIEIEVSGAPVEDGTKRGMVVDFSDLKKDLKAFADDLDHCLIIEKDSLKETTKAALDDEGFRIIELPFRPTAENLSKYVYDEMTKKGYSVVRASVYETPGNCATYSE